MDLVLVAPYKLSCISPNKDIADTKSDSSGAFGFNALSICVVIGIIAWVPSIVIPERIWFPNTLVVKILGKPNISLFKIGIPNLVLVPTKLKAAGIAIWLTSEATVDTGLNRMLAVTFSANNCWAFKPDGVTDLPKTSPT